MQQEPAFIDILNGSSYMSLAETARRLGFKSGGLSKIQLVVMLHETVRANVVPKDRILEILRDIKLEVSYRDRIPKPSPVEKPRKKTLRQVHVSDLRNLSAREIKDIAILYGIESATKTRMELIPLIVKRIQARPDFQAIYPLY